MTLMDHVRKVRATYGWRAQQYKNVFATPDGEYVLADLIKFTRAREQSFIHGSPDETAFNEGMRRVITRIERMTQMTPQDIKRIVDAFAAEDDSFENTEESYAA